MEFQVISAQSFVYLQVDIFFSPYINVMLMHNHTFRPGILPWKSSNAVMQPPSRVKCLKTINHCRQYLQNVSCTMQLYHSGLDPEIATHEEDA